MRLDRPTLVLFCGPPGSGKTTLAKDLELRGHGLRISTDDWQESLSIDHSDDGFHERLQARLYRHALQLLEHGQDVVRVDGLWMKAERDEKLADARRCGARAELHLFDLTFEVLHPASNRTAKESLALCRSTAASWSASGASSKSPIHLSLEQFDWYEIHTADAGRDDTEGPET